MPVGRQGFFSSLRNIFGKGVPSTQVFLRALFVIGGLNNNAYVLTPVTTSPPITILQAMRKRILYCVLDWGLGHATRSIPIIQSLLRRDCDIVLASDSLALKFLRSEFPSLSSYALPSYNVEYKSDSLILNGIFNFNRIRSAIKAEHALIRHIVKKKKR